jgi:hypothetical protein
MENDNGMILTSENRRTRKKPVPVPLCPPLKTFLITLSSYVFSVFQKDAYQGVSPQKFCKHISFVLSQLNAEAI